MGRSKIDFRQLNAKRISILVSRPENAARIADYFGHHQYQIDVSSDASALYTRLCEGGAPGFVFVSSQLEGPMAKMMPDFVVKRFRVPVILFNESNELPLPPLPSPLALPPEIIPAHEMAVEQILQTLENFDEVYKARLAERVSSVQAADPVLEVEKEEIDFDLEKVLSSKSEKAFQFVKEAFETADVSIVDEDVLTLHACKVADPSGRGYFVFAFPVRDGAEHTPDQALVILESRVREAAGEDAAIEHVTEGVPAKFFYELKGRSDEVVQGTLGGMEMILLYFRNRGDVEEPETRISDRNCLIPMEEWWCRLPLPCHTYVWLEKNKKRILYVRPGDCLRRESYERFQRKGLRHLVVDAIDFSHYRRIREIVHVADNLKSEAPTTAAAA